MLCVRKRKRSEKRKKNLLYLVELVAKNERFEFCKSTWHSKFRIQDWFSFVYRRHLQQHCLFFADKKSVLTLISVSSLRQSTSIDLKGSNAISIYNFNDDQGWRGALTRGSKFLAAAVFDRNDIMDAEPSADFLTQTSLAKKKARNSAIL